MALSDIERKGLGEGAPPTPRESPWFWWREGKLDFPLPTKVYTGELIT